MKKLRIGIATFTWGDNYGAVLQAHALQVFLARAGHDVEIIDFRTFSRPKGLKRFVGKSVRLTERKWKAELFERFRKAHMKFTPEVFKTKDELAALRDRYDMVISGSDQVWNPRWLAQFNGLFELCFLSFAGEGTLRVSYAASFGHSESSSIKQEWLELLADCLKRMDAVSVREESGVKLVSEIGGRSDAVHVVDPTLLLEGTYYDVLAGPRRNRENYVFCYMLHELDSDADLAVESIVSESRLKCIRCDSQRSSIHKGYSLPSPKGWIRKIRDAEFVVTNSFHAVVFCVIFQVPFIAVLVKGSLSGMNARIIDFLGDLNMQDRIIEPGGSVPKSLLRDAIVWNKAEQGMKRLTAVARGYLSRLELI
ncbi:polysaccharide pyruvyl transferase family protein [Haloferula sp.]|uniref:polysaccharide pyruvyl transferase family protein n=1 Tax=Haloferula sp. TaxID=2497595 RepID=UPI00329F1D97